MKHFLLFLTILFFASCSEKNKKLSFALQQAGNNRIELEKVLNHYKNDSLKYKATVFLIENMPNYKYANSKEVDSIKALMSQIFEQWDLTEQERQKGLNWQKHIDYEIKNDIKEIKAELLIENIDYAFKVWEEKPWNKHLSFEDFCELILPYRIAEEPLTYWRKKYYEKYNPILDSLYKGADVVEACNILSDYIKKEKFFFINDFVIPRQGADFHFSNRIGICRDACDIAIYIMRSVGIPVTSDIYAISPEYHSGHQWNVVRDTTNRYLPFLFEEYRANRDNMLIDKLKKGKVYRMTYQENKSEQKLNYPSSPLNNPFLKDVTNEYFGNNKVSIPCEEKFENVFIGVFTARNGWFVVGKGKIENKNLIFENIEPFVIYQPLTYKNNELKPITYPFMYQKDGVRIFSPKNEKQEVVLKRKYPLRKTNSGRYKNWLLLTEIKGSNNFQFSNSDLLHKMENLPSENVIEININSQKSYQYFQYQVPKDSVLSIAEIHFFDKNDKEIIFDTIYSDGKTWKNVALYQLKNCNDNDPVSFFHTWEMGTSIFFHTKIPQRIKRVQLIPRNDDNFIREGDEYELFYNNGEKGWVSLGRQTGTDKAILYYQVPKNSVLWLKNHTRGKEEQIFTYENERQVFPTFEEYGK